MMTHWVRAWRAYSININAMKINIFFNRIVLSAMLAVCCHSGVLAYVTHHVASGESMWGISKKYNITVDQLIAANPKLKDGLKAGTTIRIPEPEDLQEEIKTPEAPPRESETQSHIVRINRGNQSSPVPEYSPALTAVDISGETSGSAEKTTPEYPSFTFISESNIVELPQVEYTGDNNLYISKFGDSFASISRKTGVPIDSIVRLNPFIDESTIPEGTMIRISSLPIEHLEGRDLTLVDSIEMRVLAMQAPLAANEVTNSNVVVIALPFESDASALSRPSLHATEFYKGLLLAINSRISAKHVSPLKIIAIDTKDGIDKTIKQISDLNLDKSAIIIPADDEGLISAIEKSGNDATVLNVLSIRDNSYAENPHMIQCNINQSLMYDKAAGYIIDQLGGYTPVILNPSSGASEKIGFIDLLRKKCRDEGKEIVELNFSNKLTEKDLASLSKDKKYVFIPKSGNSDVFEKFAETLGDYFAADGSYDRLKLFGYPDWVVMRGNNEKALHGMNTQIYSRFYLDEQNIFTKDILDSYEKWYGQPMAKAFPMQAMLGYDAGNLLMDMQLMRGGDAPVDRFNNNSYDGEQSAFHFIHDNSLGLINDALYIIEYLPGETCIITVI